MISRLGLFLCLVPGVFTLSGCMTDKFVTRQEFEIHQAAVNRQIERLQADLSVSHGAIRENRTAIDVLEDQLREVSRRLGMLDEYLQKTNQLETQFNQKMTQVKQIVVEGEKRLIDEINKTRQQVATAAQVMSVEAGPSTSGSTINVYKKPSDATELDTGYYHVVGPGESISKIAARYQVPIDNIIRANGISNPDSLFVGQKLFIPDPGN